MPVMTDAQPDTESLIAALRDPEAYPHDCGTVELLQTHISLLFFAGDFVYKVKKPVDMGFLDYTTLEKRRHFCEEEVRLNRQLAPQTYLGVVQIRRSDSGAISVDADGAGAGEVLEYAVRMKRLPAERMMSALLERGEVDNELFSALAALLVAFHREAATGVGVNEYGRPEEMRRQCDETLSKLAPFAGNEADGVLSATLFEHLRGWLMRFLDDHEQLMEQRIDAGRIREGHGDLHAGNICVLVDRFVIYDCIEFNRQFRCRDVAAEVAFLAMDLDRRSCRGFAQHFLRQYAQQSGDAELVGMTGFYKANFAAVRSMVEALKSREEEVEEADRARSLEESRRYAHLAATYTIGAALIVMCGLPASGKSYAAKAIARPFEAKVLRSDVMRKRLAGVATTERAGRPFYDESFSDRVFEAMRDEAHDVLSRGRVVVVDATMVRRSRRQPFIELARSLDVPMVLVQVQCDEDEIRRRLRQRAESRSVSDADWEVYLALRGEFQEPTEVGAAQRMVVRSPVDETQLIGAVLDALAAQ